MRVALVGAEVEENLGLRYLASALRKAGHEAKIVAFDNGTHVMPVAHTLHRGDFDVVGMSMMFQLRGREFCALAERVRAIGYRGILVAGGQFATFMADEILAENPGIDVIVLGDGEAAIVDVVNALATSSPREALANVPGLVLRTNDGCTVRTAEREGRVELSALAHPARDGAPRRHLGIPSAPIVGSRGCYADCSFCSIVAWEKLSGGPKLRLRPPDHIADEMSALYHERGVRVFNFHDDNFWLPTVKANRERLASLERALDARGVHDIAMLVKCRPNDTDRELFQQCKRMGVVRTYVGIETDAPNGLITLRRGVSQVQNQRALDLMAELDIHACSNVLLFDPDTRLDDVPYNISFVERNARHTLNFCRTEPYGGTPLWRRLRDEGRLRGDYLCFDYEMREPRVELLWRICHVAFHDRNFPAEGLANSVIGLGYRFHLAKRFWPGPEIEKLRELVYDFIPRFAESQVRFLRLALDYVRDCDPMDRDFGMMFTVDLARAIRQEDARMSVECELLVRAIEAYAERRGAGGSDGRLGEGAAGSGWLHLPRRMAFGVALASATAGGACHHDTTSIQPQGQGESSSEGEATKQQRSPSGTHATLMLSGVNTSAFGMQGGGRSDVILADVHLEGPDATRYEFQQATTNVGSITDLYVTSTGQGAHFRLASPSGGRDTRGEIRAVYRDTRGGGSISSSAAFWSYADGRVSVGPRPVPAGSPYTICDPAPAPQLLPFNNDPTVHIGTTQFSRGGSHTSPMHVQWSTPTFETWLDDSVHGDIVGAPTATIDAGTVTLSNSFRPRHFRVTYDPRDANGRLVAGRHTLRVTFNVTVGGQSQAFVGTTAVVVSDDGQVVVGDEPNPRDASKLPAMPLERRFAAAIGVDPDGGSLVLTAQFAESCTDTAFLWHASEGEIVHSATSPRAVWTPPCAPGRYIVTCAVQSGRSDLAVATYSHDVMASG